jgi:hypothetical protein
MEKGAKRQIFQKLLVGIKESTNIGPQETKVRMKKVIFVIYLTVKIIVRMAQNTSLFKKEHCIRKR